MRAVRALLLILALSACTRDGAETAADVAPAALAPAVVRVPAPAPRETGRDAARGQIAYIMVRDSLSDAVMPRLADTRDPRFRAVNRQLDSISADLRCPDKVDEFGDSTDHASHVKVTHAADSILSVQIYLSGFCGGPHPIKGANLSVTYDLRTARPVEFRELFADWERDARAIVRELYPEHVAKAARMEAEGREPGPSHEETCLPLYAEEQLAQGWLYFWMRDEGLAVEPGLGHAAHACTEEAVVPYARLRRFAAPGGILERMADRPARHTTS